MNTHALAGTLARLDRKAEQAQRNASRINPARNRKHRSEKHARRVRHWYKNLFRVQDQTIDALMT